MERLGNQVEKELARRHGAGLVLTRVTVAWPAAVGEVVARQAWPLRIGRDGTLHVAASSATWAFELDRLSGEIVEQLRAVLGADAPPKVRFRVGPVPEPGAPEPSSEDELSIAPPLSAEATREADEAASAIDDPELRELAARAARASLSRARDSRRF